MGSKANTVAETPQERALADHAVAQMKDYRQRWLPLQQKLASTIQDEGKAGSSARKLAAGKASTDTAISFDKAETQLEKGLTNSGAAPGSSRANLAITGMGTDAAASTGVGKMMSEQSIDDAYTQGLGALTALGRGEKGMVGKAMEQQAQQSVMQASTDASISAMNRQGDAAMAGQVVGFGIQQGAGMKWGSANKVDSSTPMDYSSGMFGTPQAGV